MSNTDNNLSSSNNMSIYVLVADSNGDVEILQVAYETKWKDLCIMLQVKFDYDTLPLFTYTDDEEDIVCLDSQEALDEALKVCKKNDDVLHVQIRRNGAPVPSFERSHSSQSESRKSQITSTHIEMARAAMGNTIGWATNAVKSVFNRNVSSDPVTEDTCKNDPQPSNEISMEGVRLPMEVEREQTLLHEVDRSFQTNVKEVVESELDDISVPTSTIHDTEEENEVIVKEPIPSTLEQRNQDSNQIDPAMLQSIREEVRLVVSQELLTLRNEVSGLTQSITSKQFEDGDNPCTSHDLEECPRSPTEIKADIRKLKMEMKEAKQIRKVKKHNEKALKRKSFETEMISSVSRPVVETKKVRKYAASFICENLIDGSFVGVRQSFVKYWVLKNEGIVTWDEQIQLKLVDEKLTEDSSSVDPRSGDESRIDPMQLEMRYGPEKVSIGIPIVESGSTAVIAVTHIAPAIPCVYTSAWRLCRSDKFFGPRIWCSVTVKSQIDSRSLMSEESLSLVEQVSDRSYASKNWEPTRKISTEEAIGADDNLSNMLSFEMTAVGDFSKETTNVEHQNSNYSNYTVSYPPQRKQSVRETSVDITTADEVTKQNLMESAEKLEAPAQEDATEQPEELEKVEQPETLVEVPEESILLYDDRENSLNFHSIAHSEESGREIPAEDLTKEVLQVEAREMEVLDTEDQEEFHDLDGGHSDVPSDFEVIPLPECFDTTKPLSSLEKEEDESVKSHLSNLAIQEHNEEQVEDSPPAPAAVPVEILTKEETADEPAEEMDEAESEEEEVNGVEVEKVEEQNVGDLEEEENVAKEEPKMGEVIFPLSKPSASSAVTDKSVAPACLPIPQSVLDMNEPASPTMVQDYSAGYQTPMQKTASAQEPWISQPIPLPRGVLDADKPWIKDETIPKTAPLPHPRSSTHQQSFKSDPTVEMQTAHTDSPALVVEEDIETSPPICLPPQQDPEEVDEFTLAPEPPVGGPLFPILVPPGYPVPPPTIPSRTAGSPIYYPVSPPSLPDQAVPATEPPVHTPPQPHNPSPLEQLVDMGFLDIEMNKNLLQEFDGDVNKAVHALVYRGSEDHNQRRRHGRRGNGSFLA